MKIAKISGWKYRILGLFVVSAGIVGMQSFYLAFTPAHAAFNEGPNPTYMKGRQMNYLVSRDARTDILSSKFEIYTNLKSVTLRVYSPHVCSSTRNGEVAFTSTIGGWAVTDEIPYTSLPDGRNGTNANYNNTISRFTLDDTDSTASSSRDGLFLNPSSASCGSGNYYDLTLNPSTKSRDMTVGAAGMYTYEFTANIGAYTGLINGFRLQVLGDPDAVISQAAGGTGQNFGTQIATPRTSGTYGGFIIPFGPDCTVSSNKSASINLFDLDINNPPSGNVQPSDIRVAVLERPRAGGAFVSVPITWSGTTNVPNRDALGFYNPRDGDRSSSSATFTMKPDYIYQFEVKNLYKQNTLQLSIPYSTVWYTKSCEEPPPPPTWSLSPTITTTPATQVKQGGSVSMVPRVTGGNNSGFHAWKVSVARFNPGPKPTFSSPGTSNPCTGFGSTSASCTDSYESGSTNFNTASITLPPPPDYLVTPTTAVGSWFCFVLTVQQPTATSLSSQWRSSPAACVQVIPPPEFATVQMWGYDTRIGGAATAYTQEYLSGATPRLQGSWGEYGVFSTLENVGVASAAGLNEGNASNAQSDWSKLTFANSATTCGAYGCYGALSSPDELVTALQQRCPASMPTNRTVNSMNNVSTVEIICASGTVTIRGDITLRNSQVRDAGSLPQVVIIANNIVIDADVKQIDAWLIATPNAGGGGNISTCGQATDTYGQFVDFNDSGLKVLDKNTCPERLVVNGPVIADKLYLYRTRPTDSSGVEAERFNLRADAFLWAYAGGGSADPYAKTVSIHELPPRF